MPENAPPPLLEGYRHNFQILKAACHNGDLALVSAVRKSDQAPVALVCAMGLNADGSVTPVPLAVMCEGNPFEDFEDPTQDPASATGWQAGGEPYSKHDDDDQA